MEHDDTKNTTPGSYQGRNLVPWLTSFRLPSLPFFVVFVSFVVHAVVPWG